MSNMINAYLSQLSFEFLIKQSLVIIFLFVTGLIFTGSVRKKISILELLIAFPAGLSIYSLIVFVFLVTGIPVNMLLVTGAIVACIILACFMYDVKSLVKLDNIRVEKVALLLITVLCISVICCLGVFSISISNDSLYYYSMYPRAIISYEGFKSSFNVFLTDVGPASAIIGTIPFVYGFNENFGIQTFLNVDEALLFIHAVYSEVAKRFDDNKRASVIMAGIAGLLLISSMPYIIMCKWIMSNGYFMNYLFVCVYLAYRICNEEKDSESKIQNKELLVISLLFTTMSLLRMEGAIIAIVVIICVSTLKYTNKQLFCYYLLPVATAVLLYDVRIFIFMKIDAPYTFLTKQNAAIELMALICAGIYLLLIRGRILVRLQERLAGVVLIGLVLVNGVLAIMDRTLYVENMKVFIANLSNQSGWGLFPMIVIAAYVMAFIIGGKKLFKITYWDFSFFTYLLTALAVSFARDDALVENVADSGNRVLLQVTLICFFAVVMKVTDCLEQ